MCYKIIIYSVIYFSLYSCASKRHTNILNIESEKRIEQTEVEERKLLTETDINKIEKYDITINRDIKIDTFGMVEVKEIIRIEAKKEEEIREVKNDSITITKEVYTEEDLKVIEVEEKEKKSFKIWYWLVLLSIIILLIKICR